MLESLNLGFRVEGLGPKVCRGSARFHEQRGAKSLSNEA